MLHFALKRKWKNVRRRATRDVENAHKFGQEKLIQNLLPVIDSLEKAIESAEQAGADEGANQAILEGVGPALRCSWMFWQKKDWLR